MSKKMLLNTNPVVILAEFEKAVLHDYLFVPGRSDLFISPSGLIELELFRQEMAIPKVTFEDALDVITLVHHDKTSLMLDLQKYILSGWRVDLKSVYYDVVGSKICKLVHPEHPVSKVYSKEELDQMDFEELKAISRLRGCFNRQRSVLIANVLKFQEDRQ